MVSQHYTDNDTLEAAIVGFCAFCRVHNLPLGLNHCEEALEAARNGFISDQSSLKYALKALFCTCEEEHSAYERAFDIYWRKKQHSYNPKTRIQKQTRVLKESRGSVVMMGFGDKEESEREEAHNVSGANKMESLRKTDFSKVPEIDSKLLDTLAEKLLEQLNHRLKRRLRSSRKGKIDIRKSIRSNISSGDNLFDLLKKNRRTQKYRLILLLDVSGSMDKYSFYLLKFLWSLKSNFKDLEAFIFSTKLVRITDFIDQSQISQAMLEMTAHADHWSSGTTIGQCLREFNQLYAKRILNGRSITIVLSDGLETGSPELLADQLGKIRARTSKLIWLNPLKGMEGYQPLARGMQAALPEIDTFASAHNLTSLMDLEKHLAHVQ